MRFQLLIYNFVIGASLLTSPTQASATVHSKTLKHSAVKLRGKGHSVVFKEKETNPGDLWRIIGANLRLPRPSLDQLIEMDPTAPEMPVIHTEPLQPTSDEQLKPRISTTIPPEMFVKPKHFEPESLPEPINPRFKRLINPSVAVPPEDKYTALGRKLLGKSAEEQEIPVSKEINKDCVPEKIGISAVDAAKLPFNSQFRRPPYPPLERTKNPLLAAKQISSREANTPDRFGKFGMPCKPKFSHKLSVIAGGSLTVKPEPDFTHSGDAVKFAQLAMKQRELSQQQNDKILRNYERVDKFIKWYSERRGVLYEVAIRARPYLHHIVEGLNKRNMPLDLALLPIVESGYQATALSPKSAAGLWQFIPGTGQDFGLTQTAYYDERLDIMSSTQAAYSFLSHLHQRFKGDWLLALAAYNCGAGCVDDAIYRNSSENLDTDFWSLPLPEETKDYVPRLLALSSIFANPESMGFKIPSVRNEPYFVKVQIDQKIDLNNLNGKTLAEVANYAGLAPEKFQVLNPGFLVSTLATEQLVSFLLPIDNANTLLKHLRQLANLETAIQNKAPTFSIASPPLATETTNYQSPYFALTLNTDISVNSTESKQAEESTDSVKKPRVEYLIAHYIAKGETLNSVARDYGVNLQALRNANKLKNKQGVVLGQRLTIPKPAVNSVMFSG